MENSPVSVEEKILLAAIECVEKYGVQETTNRKIAEMAGTNSAAINYYFRSKEVLIQRVMERTLANAFDWKDFAELQADTPQEYCVGIFDNLIEGAVKYPGITRAHFYELITSGNYESPVVKSLNDFIHHLCLELKQRGMIMDQKELEAACLQITSAVFFIALCPRIFANGFAFDASLLEQRTAFLTKLVNDLLH